MRPLRGPSWRCIQEQYLSDVPAACATVHWVQDRTWASNSPEVRSPSTRVGSMSLGGLLVVAVRGRPREPMGSRDLPHGSTLLDGVPYLKPSLISS